MSELRSLKARIEELESEIKEKDEEVKTLKESSSQKLTNGGTEDSSEAVKVSLSKFFVGLNLKRLKYIVSKLRHTV